MEALPEEALLMVLTGVGPDAKMVARCAPVCKRWCSVVRYVDALSFTVAEGSTEKELRPLYRMLQKSHCLRALTLNVEPHAYFTSDLHKMVKLVSSTLESLCISGVADYEESFWVRLKRCHKLKKLCLKGGNNGLTFAQPVCNMKNLREFILDESSIQFPETVWSAAHAGYRFGAEMETLLKHCPKLEMLVVKKLLTYKIKMTSNTLREAHLQGLDCRAFVMLEAENLRCLTIDSLGCVLCSPKLTQLHLPSRCKDLIVTNLDALELLTMGGDGWEFDEIHGIMGLATTVRNLSMELSVVDPKPIVWSTFFKDLRNLRTLGLGGNLLQCFCDESDRDAISKLKLRKLTVNLEEKCFNFASVRAMVESLLENCFTLKEVVVKCTTLLAKEQQGSSALAMEMFISSNVDLHSGLLELRDLYSSRLRVLF